MRRRQVLAGSLGATTLLPGCTIMQPLGQATGVLDASGVVSLYGIAKGIAEVALIADPGLSLIVNAALAIAGPLLADVQAHGAAAAASAAALAAQSNALLLATAGAITARPNASSPARSAG